MTHFYGLRPWEVERMTLREINEYRTQYRDYQQEQERQQNSGR